MLSFGKKDLEHANMSNGIHFDLTIYTHLFPIEDNKTSQQKVAFEALFVYSKKISHNVQNSWNDQISKYVYTNTNQNYLQTLRKWDQSGNFN